MHDPTYKRLFAFPRMVEDLLRAFVPGEWLAAVDFSTLEKLSAEYVSDALRRRHGDAVWRVRVRDEWLHVLVLLEFQSTGDPDMALRILTYTALLYQELGRNDAMTRPRMGPGRRRPPVLPVVLYNGAAPWTAPVEVRELIAPAGPNLAPYQPSQRYVLVDERHVETEALPGGNLMTAMVGLEQSEGLADLIPVVEVLGKTLRDPRDAGLREVFVEWVEAIARRQTPDGVQWVRAKTLEELQMNLVERSAEWPKRLIAQGLEQGLEQGKREGIEQGLVHERALLRRMAATRFGEETAERLSEVLEGVADPERLAEVGEWLVRCDTGDDLLARVGATLGRR